MYLKHLILDEEISVEYVIGVLSTSDVQLHFRDIESFNKSFLKFNDILLTYAEKIKSLAAPEIGIVFEDTVKILSILEDSLEININHVVINAEFYEDIRQLIDFYFDDLQDGSLTIDINLNSYNKTDNLKSPIEIIAYIERNSILGVGLSIDFGLFSDFRIFSGHEMLLDSILPYLNTAYNTVEIDGFNGIIINFKGCSK